MWIYYTGFTLFLLLVYKSVFRVQWTDTGQIGAPGLTAPNRAAAVSTSGRARANFRSTDHTAPTARETHRNKPTATMDNALVGNTKIWNNLMYVKSYIPN